MKHVGFSQFKGLSLSLFAVLGLALGGCAGDDMGSTDTDDTTESTTNETNATETSESATTGETDGTDGTDGTEGTDGTDTDPTTTDGAVDYEADIQPIWDARCVAGCHSPGGSKADIPLGPGESHGTLVGQPSVQLPSMNMVEAGDLDKSYLWHKLNNAQADVGGSGSSMPLGGMLDAADLSKVESWITSGAEM